MIPCMDNPLSANRRRVFSLMHGKFAVVFGMSADSPNKTVSFAQTAALRVRQRPALIRSARLERQHFI